MTPTPELIAEIDALYEKATKGPWEEVPQAGAGPMIAHEFDTGDQMRPTGLRLICHMLQRRNSLEEDRANAAFIVALVNHWPAIKQALSRERRDALEDAAKLRCKYCRDGVPFEGKQHLLQGGGSLMGGPASYYKDCDAQDIRALAKERA